MMNNVYIATESLAALIILIIVYANIFEEKQQSNKRTVFTKLLITNELVVLVDAISWMPFNWKKYPVVLGMLIVCTYILPTAMQAFFSLYIYEHISIKTKVSKKPFHFIVLCSFIEFLLTCLFCISGKLFFIENGKYYAGSLDSLYFILNLLVMVMLIIIVIFNGKKMSKHDLIAALSFCIVPFLSIIITVTTGFNISITLMSVSMVLMYVMLQSENENTLFHRVNIDELTGLYNRRAYENEISKYASMSEVSDLVYVSVDVNGLKVTNDTLGHAAGDELICGAAACLDRVFGKYGKVFRIGGDEFVSIFFANEEQLKRVINALEDEEDHWQGDIVENLALSVGYVTKREYPTESIVEIAKIADKRMYDDKSRYYARKGVDRRGQNEAYKVLCSLYTKILKINITDNTYKIINMNLEEQIKEKGFAETISEWLEGFGKSGQIHPDDLEEYLSKTNLDYMQKYFKRGKNTLSVIYRRKEGVVFKQVMMEIIPTSEYSYDNQSLFLYVKKIDI